MAKELSQVRIYKSDRDWFALQAKKQRTTTAEIIRQLRKKV